jgi:NAD-dependent SIR2 family protein deacetylase
MTCDKCKFLILKNSLRGPMCFKGINIKTVKNCKSYEEYKEEIGGLKPDLVIIDDPIKELNGSHLDPIKPNLKDKSKLIMIGTPYERG